MFCSSSIGVHLFRGLMALVLVAAGLYLLGTPTLWMTLLAVACFGGAFLLFRGCPMCWLMGLFETMANQRASRRAAQESGQP